MLRNNPENQRSIAIARNGMLDSIITFLDALDLGVIYTMFFAPVLHQFLEEIGRYFLFPIAAVASGIEAILAWRHAKLEKFKSNTLALALVKTVAFVGISVAVIGALVSGYFSVATPAIFIAVVGGKTLFHAASAVYYAGKASATTDPVEKAKHREMAKKSIFQAVAGAVATAAVVGVFLLGKFALAAVGVVGAVMLAGLAIYKGYQAHKAAVAAKTVEKSEHDVENPGPRNSLEITKQLEGTEGLRTSANNIDTSEEATTPTPVAPGEIVVPKQEDGINHEVQPLLESPKPGKK